MNMRISILLLCLVGSLGCKKNDDPISSSTTIEPTLKNIQAKVFNNCSMPSCHGSSGKAGLSLIDGQSYAQLINQPSTNDNENKPAFLRVKPFVPDSSFLYIKITNPHSGTQGERMPQGSAALSQLYVNAIKTWIAQGAQNN